MSSRGSLGYLCLLRLLLQLGTLLPENSGWLHLRQSLLHKCLFVLSLCRPDDLNLMLESCRIVHSSNWWTPTVSELMSAWLSLIFFLCLPSSLQHVPGSPFQILCTRTSILLDSHTSPRVSADCCRSKCPGSLMMHPRVEQNLEGTHLHCHLH